MWSGLTRAGSGGGQLYKYDSMVDLPRSISFAIATYFSSPICTSFPASTTVTLSGLVVQSKKLIILKSFLTLHGCYTVLRRHRQYSTFAARRELSFNPSFKEKTPPCHYDVQVSILTFSYISLPEILISNFTLPCTLCQPQSNRLTFLP